MFDWGVPVHEAILLSEATAIIALDQSLGFDVFAQPLFWEHVLARHLGGSVTSHQSECDIEVEVGQSTFLAEVKFSRSFHAAFFSKTDRDVSRRVFKWARPRGFGGKNSADACMLVGLDEGLLFLWVVPNEAIKPNCASITMTVPAARVAGRSQWDRFAVPFDAALGAFIRTCHLRLDREHHAVNSRATRNRKAGQDDLFRSIAA